MNPKVDDGISSSYKEESQAPAKSVGDSYATLSTTKFPKESRMTMPKIRFKELLLKIELASRNLKVIIESKKTKMAEQMKFFCEESFYI